MYTVLGASGYIGSALARCLTAAGEACFAPKRGDDSLFHRPLGHVIYCVGLTADYAQRPLEAVEAHVGFLRDVLAGAKFDSLVYLSSTRLYDSQPAGGAGTPCREDGDLVLNPNTPRHIYDLSKATGEAMCLQASGGRGRAVRLSCVYGGDIGQDSFLHTTIRKALTHPSLELATAPDTARDYVHLDDVVRLLPEIARRGARGLYNLASGVNVTNRELLAAIGEATGCSIGMTGQGGVAAPLVSVERLREEFGFRPIGVLGAVPELVRQAAVARGGAHRAAS
jgi:nucleoside-diphosphate-sugar epimerase